ncbi:MULTISPECIES: cupin domain-containing protein [unclassified Meiothermus]|uniref:cupin domain-containing protein n=1 Tax=unclassified Meiothermus TaxID=370471 RepID=UPI000D7D20C5|nr:MULTISPECIES: cupin domain-containing protein [unclassified Meiothermus]PZA05930.1 cupin domain-containing protein [Meiothermus sp. Pnk-1]RYM36466.1 cupin domain-containing protein [Meiothermus sp. PNK-Is4]
MQFNGEWETVGPGVERRLVALGKRMMAVRVRFAKGAVGALHAHPHEQLTQVLSGRFRFQVGEEVLEVAAGDLLCIPGGLEHGTQALEAGELLDIFSPLREDLLGGPTASPE